MPSNAFTMGTGIKILVTSFQLDANLKLLEKNLT